jgi:triosephosphate isomerase
MQKLVVANWKMNPATPEEAQTLASGYRTVVPRSPDVQMIACPPTPFLALLHDLTPAFKLGAQDLFWEDLGPYTGAVSPLQLKNLSVSWVIVGHSERRAQGDVDEAIAKKIIAAHRSGLHTILCVGESAELHAQKSAMVEKFIEGQLDGALGAGELKKGIDPARIVIAYEPVWALSNHSGDVSDDPADAMERITHIKQYLAKRFGGTPPQAIYGGSVAPHNAHSFFKYAGIDGVLVGGASLDAQAMKAIVQSAINVVSAPPGAYLEKE